MPHRVARTALTPRSSKTGGEISLHNSLLTLEACCKGETTNISLDLLGFIFQVGNLICECELLVEEFQILPFKCGALLAISESERV
jgi:hypothetical protein